MKVPSIWVKSCSLLKILLQNVFAVQNDIIQNGSCDLKRLRICILIFEISLEKSEMADQKSVEERNNFDEKKKCNFPNKTTQNCK